MWMLQQNISLLFGGKEVPYLSSLFAGNMHQRLFWMDVMLESCMNVVEVEELLEWVILFTQKTRRMG